MSGDRYRAEVGRQAPDRGAEAHLLLVLAEVGERCAELNGGGAGAARESRLGEEVADVHAVELAQVDLAQDPAVVPPAAAGGAVVLVDERRQVGLGTATVDAHNEVVHAAPSELVGGHLKREVCALVGPDLVAVQVHARAVVHRLEADDPAHAAAGLRSPEVGAVPAHAAALAGVREVVGVPGVGDGDGRPARERRLALEALCQSLVERVAAEVPGAIHQVAARVAVVVQHLRLRRIYRGAGHARKGEREQRDGE